MPVKKTKEETIARRADILRYMESLGPFSIPATKFAEDHGVTVKTIYNDRDFWIKKIDFKKIDLEGKKLIMTMIKNLAITEELKVTGTPSSRLRAVQSSNQTAEVYTKLLEQYGFKEKIADNLNIHAEKEIIFQEIIKSNDEIKELKDGQRDNSKPKTG